MDLGKWTQSAKTAAEHARDLSGEATERLMDSATQIADAGKQRSSEALDNVMEEISGLRPLLARCGLSVGGIDCSISLTPEISLSIIHSGEAKESLEQLMADQGENLSAFQRAVLTGLMHANDWTTVPRRFGYRPASYNLALGVPPSVAVKFVPMRDEENEELDED